MENKFGYLKKEDRKTILLLCDDLRMHSGIATMAKEFVFGSVQHFNWVQLGAAIKHPDAGKSLDLSQDVANTQTLKMLVFCYTPIMDTEKQM